MKELIISTIETYAKDLEKTVILRLPPDLIPICEKQFVDLLNAYKEVTMEKLKVAEVGFIYSLKFLVEAGTFIFNRIIERYPGLFRHTQTRITTARCRSCTLSEIEYR